MTKDEIQKALLGRLRCVRTKRDDSGCCGDTAAAGRGAGYMASCRGGRCRLIGDVARGTICSSCDYACNRWYRELCECQDDGEVSEVLGKACVGWTPPQATNRIPGEAEP